MNFAAITKEIQFSLKDDKILLRKDIKVNLRNPLHACEKVGKLGNHPGFETQGRNHQKSKTGVSVASQKEPVSSNKKFKINIKGVK